MKKHFKLGLLGLFLAWIALSAVREILQWSNHRNAQRQADAWLASARQIATSKFTKENAVDWLRQNGAEKIGVSGSTWIDGFEFPNLRVVGYRVFSDASYWTMPLTAQLEFAFDDGWRFREVELEILNYAFHPNSRE
jgi:hypothetical protein